MKQALIVSLALLLSAGLCYADITFTGDASVDFNNPSTVWAYDPCGENDVNITSQMRHANVLSGWDIYRIGFYYDRINDVMYIGWDYHGRICGDADGDGNPSGETYLQNNAYDIANLGEGETITLWIDTDNSGGSEGGDIVLGIGRYADASQYAVTYENAGYGNPSNSFGAPVPAAAGSYLYNAPAGPDAARPDFECTINNYSQMPYVPFSDRLHDEVSFGIHVYSGSWEDAVVGYDKFTNSCWLNVTIPGIPESDSTITHFFPRDLYVLQGIPLEVPNGDPPVVLGPPFSTNPAGSPYWRVSRWDTDNQTYIRYGEPDYPININQDPPPLQPGMGFWIVQDCEDSVQVEVTGQFFNPGDTVRVPLQNALPNGTIGMNMLANPFHIPITWGNCLVQRADHSQPPMTIMEGFNAGIVCHYVGAWDVYNNQYIVKDVDDVLAPWTGFWFCVFDSLYEWEVIFVYPATDDLIPSLSFGSHQPPGLDQLNDWSFYIGLVADNIRLIDACNYIGISSNASDQWDGLDAGEMAPMVSSGGYVHLYFPHLNWTFRPGNFAFDFRQGPFTGVKTWQFDVRSFQYAGDILMVWDGVAQLSPEYQASLLDAGGSAIVEDMTLTDIVPITIASGEIQRYQIRVERLPQGVNDLPDNVLKDFTLSRANPNPFNNASLVTLSLPTAANVRLALYDITGSLVRTVVENNFTEGSHIVSIDGSGLASGLYFLKAEANGETFNVQKLVLLK